EVSISEVRPGDVCQLIIDEADWQHTPVIIAVGRNARTYSNIWVAAHSYDCDCRPLSSYAIREARFIHIDGVREIMGSSMQNTGETPDMGTTPSELGTPAIPAPPSGPGTPPAASSGPPR
ncbi:MAG TPA: hypothetical protein PKV62_07445, partial [Oscillospiraceae bacterium]|nr:hypothetical protein [Oscillospiraceae bacterium]